MIMNIMGGATYTEEQHTPWRNMMWTKALKINITYFNNFCLPAVRHMVM